MHLGCLVSHSGIGVVIRTTRAQSGFNEGSLLLFVAIGVILYATGTYYRRMHSLEIVRGGGSVCGANGVIYYHAYGVASKPRAFALARNSTNARASFFLGSPLVALCADR